VGRWVGGGKGVVGGGCQPTITVFLKTDLVDREKMRRKFFPATVKHKEPRLKIQEEEDSALDMSPMATVPVHDIRYVM
jgi:hypothetical protein